MHRSNYQETGQVSNNAARSSNKLSHLIICPVSCDRDLHRSPG